MTSTKPSPSPRVEQPAPAAVGIAERVASDLHAVADIAAAHPHLARHIAAAVEQLHITLHASSDLNPEDFGDALTSRAATVVPDGLHEPLWSTQAWMLPAGSIRLTVTQLAVPIEDLIADGSEFASAGAL